VSFALRRLVKARAHNQVDIGTVRAWVNTLMGLHFLSGTGVTIRDFTDSGLRGEWLTPPGEPGGRVLLYLHGGGYFFCSPRTHRPVTVNLCRRARAYTLALRYRLAPEHPFPAALEDAVGAYLWLLDMGYHPAQIGLAGDSAGGGLALATLVYLRDSGLPLPAAAVCFSPWTDLAGTGRSLDANDEMCAMFSAQAIRRGAQIYLAGADPRSPLVSPLYADLRGLPPLLLHVSDSEVLLDDSTRLAEKAREAGVPTRLKVWPRQPHVWQLFAPVLPEGRQSLQEAAEFLCAHLRAGSAWEGLQPGYCFP
jgi:acetyl esterase/lipase